MVETSVNSSLCERCSAEAFWISFRSHTYRPRSSHCSSIGSCAVNPLHTKVTADITSRCRGVSFEFHGDVLPTQIPALGPRKTFFLCLAVVEIWLASATLF